MKVDKITQEIRLLGHENISTDEQLFSYKKSVIDQIEVLTQDREVMRKQLKKNLSDDELSKVKQDISSITSKLRTLKKELKLCDGIAQRSKVIEHNLSVIEQDEQKIKRKEKNRNVQRW